MRQPSPHAQHLLQQLLLGSFFSAADLQALLINIGRQNLAFNINWGGSAISYVGDFVLKSTAAGFLDATLLDALGAHVNLVNQKTELDKIRVYLELLPSGHTLVGPTELVRLKALALKAKLQQPLTFARLDQVTLPLELRRQAAGSLDKLDRIDAWIDAANRQTLLPGDPVWMAEIFKRANDEAGVDQQATQEALDLLSGKGLGATSPVDVTTPGGLEKVVKQFGIVADAGIFFDGFKHASARVCAVFINGIGRGTGFLVGEDLVLTNYHVLESVLNEGGDPTLVELVFELVTVDGKEQRGPVAHLAQAADVAAKPWLIDATPPTDIERKPGPQPDLDHPPPATHLDFALVRIDKPLGKTRGSFSLKSTFDFPTTAPIIILGHPAGQDGTLGPQVWAIEPESIIGHNETRVRYRTNTLSGSSGSPVMNMQWELVALHHFGQDLLFNQGIPVSALRARPAVAAALG